MSTTNFNDAIDSDFNVFSKFPGLTNKDALNHLYCEILKFKYEIGDKGKKKDFLYRIIKSSFHHSSYYSTFSWIPICILILISVALLFLTNIRFGVVVIVFLLTLNMITAYWNNHLRFTEFKNRIDYVLKTLKRVKKKNNWRLEQFPNLYTPHSPSVSLQWTIRDGQLINLPSVLLVKGDIVIMRPGQQSPADIETVHPPPSADNKYNVLVTDQLFACEPTVHATEIVESDVHRIVERPPVEDRLYEVINAPYIAHLNAITDKYLERPTSLYDKARYLLFGKCLHHVLLPSCLILCEILAVIRWYVFPHLHCKSCTQFERWTYFFVIETSAVLILLVSLMFPIFWFVSNAVGNALLLSRYSFLENEEKTSNKKSRGSKKSESSFFDDCESSFRSFTESAIDSKRCKRNNFWHLFVNFIQNNGVIVVRCTNFLHTMASVTVLCCVDKKGVLSFPNPIAEKVFFLKNTSKNNSYLTKNCEINNDGSHTVTCNKEDSNIDGDVRKVTEDSRNEKSSSRVATTVEILDITPRDDKGSAWKIEFDDSRWRCHLPSLKPLGLAILLNTCHRKTHSTYNRFCAHITSHALQNKHLVPVANRRCLCELARQIGFQELVVEEKYNLELQLFTYKNLSETQTGNKYVKALLLTRKPKFPFPHAMSVIVNSGYKTNNGRSNMSRKEKKEDERKRRRSMNDWEEKHMFSQGTADVILDYCVDYWDGYEVHPLTAAIRKKILDFYQRSNLTAYCTAFSYRPVYKNLQKTSRLSLSSTVYVELLKNVELRLRPRRRKRRRQRRCDVRIDECNNTQSQQFEQNEINKVPTLSVSCKLFYRNECESTEMEFVEPVTLPDVTECDEEIDDTFGEVIEEYDENVDYSIDECETNMEYDDYSDESDDDDEDYGDLDDDGCKSTNGADHKHAKKLSNQNPESRMNYFQILGKQIFLGMVSMQYQPLVDMVQMIEELEKACIRFVHFSKENELRSRVFSEKMGLESGWNCHISLLPDADMNSLIEGYEGISLTVDQEISSTVETGASSADDEENVPFTFDMSNRAKLPCGIKNIKPHLEQVDNVPLLVSLFTDCTSDTTEQMLAIMQEYGQVVCVLGSSANTKNLSLFAQADASISVEPLYAQVCQQIPSSPLNEKREGKYLSPTELSDLLNSLPCSLILQRNYNYHRILPIYPLIAESRNVMRLVWNCCQFWLCCIALTMTVQLLALFLLFPAIFTLEQSLWISIVMTPCLSISLATASYDDAIMTKAKGKDWLCSVNWTTIKDAVTCYGTKLLCGIVAIIISYIIELMTVCDCLSKHYNSLKIAYTNDTILKSPTGKTHCVYVFFLTDFNDEDMESEYVNTLSIIQTHMALILSLNLVALCVSFLHRDSVCWKKIPRFSSVWLIFVLLPLTIQIIHFVLVLNYWRTDCLVNNISLLSVKSSILTLFSPCLTYFISEIVKIHEIRINERYQKKVRLEFGTKLGMNSPF